MKTLEISVGKATRLSHRGGIFTNRVNEVGNHIESYVRNALNEEDLETRD